MSQSTSTRILCLWLPDWPVQRYLQKHPECRSRAFAFSAKAGPVEEIVSCSPKAGQLGICAGIRTPDAEALAGVNQLDVITHQPQEDRRALEQLAAECQCFSPFVALESTEAPTSLLLDVKGSTPLWGATLKLAELKLLGAVDQWSKKNKLNVLAAIASTPGLAWAAAHFLEWLPDGDEDRRILPADGYREIAEQLPVESLRVDGSTIEVLHSLGIENVGQLLSLPRSSLRSRFGLELPMRLEQLCGRTSEPLAFCWPSQSLAVQWPFETAVTNSDVLASVLYQLLEQLTQRLVKRQFGALHVQIRYVLDTSRRPPLTKRLELRLFRPTICPKELSELAAIQICDLKFSHPVKSIHVQIIDISPLEIRQKKLFDEESPHSAHELAMLINRLSSRVGSSRVLRVERQSSHDPRKSFCYRPATEFAAKPYRLTNQQTQRLRRYPIALHSEQSPPVRVKTHADNTPLAIFRAGWQEVTHTWGPERLETGWWHGRGYRRDAYWIELNDGTRFWICCDLRTQQWRIAGEFF